MERRSPNGARQVTSISLNMQTSSSCSRHLWQTLRRCAVVVIWPCLTTSLVWILLEPWKSHLWISLLWTGASDEVPSSKIHWHRAGWQPGPIPSVQGSFFYPYWTTLVEHLAARWTQVRHTTTNPGGWVGEMVGRQSSQTTSVCRYFVNLDFPSDLQVRFSFDIRCSWSTWRSWVWAVKHRDVWDMLCSLPPMFPCDKKCSRPRFTRKITTCDLSRFPVISCKNLLFGACV